MKKKYLIIIMMTILLIVACSIRYIKPKQVEVSDIQIGQEPIATEGQKTYTQYEANITFKENYFKGKQFVKYVYNGNAPINELLFKLYLNIYAKDSIQKPYFIDQVPLVIDKKNTYGYISVSEIKIDGQICESREKDGNLWINLPKHIQKGQVIEIEMNLEGCVPKIDYRIGSEERKTWVNGFLPHIAIYDEEEGWITTNSYTNENFIYADMADYNVSLNVDRDIMPIASGVLIEEMESAGGKKKYVFQAKRVRDFGVYLGTYLNKFRVDLKDGKSIDIYTADEMNMEKIQTRLQEAFEYYGRIFGSYPYESFSIVDDPNLTYMVSYPNLLIGDLDKLLLDDSKLYETVGKQWIPYIIMHHPTKEAYLNDSLMFYLARRATISTLSMHKYVENLNSTYDLNTIVQRPYAMYKNYYKEQVLRPLTLFLDMEETLGEQKFQALLGNYYKKYAFRLPKESDFLKFFLEESNMPLSSGFYRCGDIIYREENYK